jgi:hypothetical protein
MIVRENGVPVVDNAKIRRFSRNMQIIMHAGF